MPSKLQEQVTFLQNNPNHGAVVGFQKMYLEKGATKPHWLKPIFLQEPQPGYLPSTLMVRRDLFRNILSFDATWEFSSDVDWFFKASEKKIPIGLLETVVINRRIHGDNNSNQCNDIHKELLWIMKQSLQRKRSPHVS
jgi:hypothetical protein